MRQQIRRVMQVFQAKAKPIFELALGISEREERRAYVIQACGTDPALREEVESLLEAYAHCGSFLKQAQRSISERLRTPGTNAYRFGDYELLQEIARGGMGIVYRARQISLNRIVAVKMILAGQFASEHEVSRFRTEAQAAASLTHPNIVTIYEVGEHDGQHYFSMPFVEGKSLEELVTSGQWLPGDGREAARMVAKIARAVQFAHEAGIMHRDLKPGNILVTEDGEPRVTDFGLAKQVRNHARLTLTGDLLGTPGFMAPEQARGRSGVSAAASDVYSLGALLYFLLTRQAPFTADSPLDAMLLALESEAVQPRRINPRVPGQLEHTCLRCLEKRPEDRYASAGQMADELERFLKGEALAFNQQAIGRRFESWAKRRPALAARLCTVLLCLTIVVTAYQIHHYTTLAQHLAVISVLVFWLLISFGCQRGLENERHAGWIRLVWSAADPISLTAILLIAQGFGSPLLILYPTLIAASGFWLRVPLVATTTGTSLLGYLVLLLEATHRSAGTIPFHWHILAFVGIVVTGFSVTYLVNRVSALTRFYEQRPRSDRVVPQ
jgi:serine/threonine-protein kinase